MHELYRSALRLEEEARNLRDLAALDEPVSPPASSEQPYFSHNLKSMERDKIREKVRRKIIVALAIRGGQYEAVLLTRWLLENTDWDHAAIGIVVGYVATWVTEVNRGSTAKTSMWAADEFPLRDGPGKRPEWADAMIRKVKELVST